MKPFDEQEENAWLGVPFHLLAAERNAFAHCRLVIRFAMVGTPCCGVTVRVQRTESRFHRD
ncbi:MAG TPA: hypothetical protein VJT54_11555 [Verrucomicrobiae bacterium]|nr:hypothetical protein [Verrucomicrobiae bacterium]